jgi:hypothetical protein
MENGTHAQDILEEFAGNQSFGLPVGENIEIRQATLRRWQLIGMTSTILGRSYNSPDTLHIVPVDRIRLLLIETLKGVESEDEADETPYIPGELIGILTQWREALEDIFTHQQSLLKRIEQTMHDLRIQRSMLETYIDPFSLVPPPELVFPEQYGNDGFHRAKTEVECGMQILSAKTDRLWEELDGTEEGTALSAIRRHILQELAALKYIDIN